MKKNIYFGKPSNGKVLLQQRLQKRIGTLRAKIAAAESRVGKTLSHAGKQFIISHEGFRQESYYDPVNRLTIGYGTEKRFFDEYMGYPLVEGTIITEAKARELFFAYFKRKGVYAMLKAVADDDEFTALCSFAYNAGEGALLTPISPKFANTKGLRFPGKITHTIRTPRSIVWMHRNGLKMNVACAMSYWRTPPALRKRRVSEINLLLR